MVAAARHPPTQGPQGAELPAWPRVLGKAHESEHELPGAWGPCVHDLPGASSSLTLHKSEFDEAGHCWEMLPMRRCQAPWRDGLSAPAMK